MKVIRTVIWILIMLLMLFPSVLLSLLAVTSKEFFNESLLITILNFFSVMFVLLYSFHISYSVGNRFEKWFNSNLK